MYFTEDDWCLRMRASGFTIMYAPLGPVVHPEGASVSQGRRLARRIYFEDLIRYVEKHFGRTRAACLWMLTRPSRWALDLTGWVRSR